MRYMTEGTEVPAPCQGGRVCVVVPSTDDVGSKGMLLGSSPGGGTMYIEPHRAVSLNNDLAAARGKARAAEEAVLWRLTGAVAEAMDGVQSCLATVSVLL